MTAFNLSLWWPAVLPDVATYQSPPAGPPRVALLAQFSGGGQLAGALTKVAAEFGGTGTLSAMVTSVHPQFTGEGTLSALALLKSVHVAADFIGAGNLSGQVAG
jgi:hypothetical protein